jgi:GDP/UDP-N,N'-diacetylbacillosamine 2-epimerase (hydrolysing)
MHLSPKFGYTYREIENDGFTIDRKIECLTAQDSPRAISNAVSKVLRGCAAVFEEIKPDLVLVVGDRFEVFAAASAALLARVPIGHIHGGEVTEGALDEAFRHSVTKMSSIHFVATQAYARRVVQLGEDPLRVHVVGGLGVEAIKNLELMNRQDLEKSFNLRFGLKNLLIVLHPETLGHQNNIHQVGELLTALSGLKDTTLIVTQTNSDSGGHYIMNEMKRFAAENQNVFLYDSLGQLAYLSCLAQVDGIVGNSSSGILEAPTLKIGTVNIGERQKGRLQAESIINCDFDSVSIRGAISKLYEPEYQSILRQCTNPYEYDGGSQKIIDVLQRIDLHNIDHKRFYDLPRFEAWGVAT